MAKTLKDKKNHYIIIESKNTSVSKQTANRNSKKVKEDSPKIIIKTYKDGHVIAEYSGMDMPRCIFNTRLQERKHRKLENQMKRSIEKLYDLDTIYSSSMDYFYLRNKPNNLNKEIIHNNYKVQFSKSMRSIWEKVGGYVTDAIEGSEEKLANGVECW